MEQLSFSELFNNDNFLDNEFRAYTLMDEFWVDILKGENLNSESVFFKPGDAEKSQYSSVYFLNEGNLLCRICFRGKSHYLSVSSKYMDLLPSDSVYKILSSEPNYCRINLDSVESILLYRDVLLHILTVQIDAIPTDFGCCSRYIECSDQKKCIHPDSDSAIRCAYRKNLKKGKIFYGKNRNI